MPCKEENFVSPLRDILCTRSHHLKQSGHPSVVPDYDKLNRANYISPVSVRASKSIFRVKLRCPVLRPPAYPPDPSKTRRAPCRLYRGARSMVINMNTACKIMSILPRTMAEYRGYSQSPTSPSCFLDDIHENCNAPSSTAVYQIAHLRPDGV